VTIPPAATDDLSVTTTHSGGQKCAGMREMRILKQNLAYEIPGHTKIPVYKAGFFVPKIDARIT
jgi:hypothetical protein